MDEREPQESADACLRLLGDDGLRARLTEEAYTRRLRTDTTDG
jgi:hypothetical protein